MEQLRNRVPVEYPAALTCIMFVRALAALFDLEPESFMSDNNLLWYAQSKQLPEPEVISGSRPSEIASRSGSPLVSTH